MGDCSVQVNHLGIAQVNTVFHPSRVGIEYQPIWIPAYLAGVKAGHSPVVADNTA